MVRFSTGTLNRKGHYANRNSAICRFLRLNRGAFGTVANSAVFTSEGEMMANADEALRKLFEPSHEEIRDCMEERRPGGLYSESEYVAARKAARLQLCREMVDAILNDHKDRHPDPGLEGTRFESKDGSVYVYEKGVFREVAAGEPDWANDDSVLEYLEGLPEGSAIVVPEGVADRVHYEDGKLRLKPDHDNHSRKVPKGGDK